jgi:YidC/Oxa1 family membrane protein insertase
MTIIIKLLFFPLTQKGFKSTAKMQALNPKIEEIKAKYKDNAQKMQAEIAALYKSHNINPLAGCLPWLIQIPIFIGLLTMLRNQFDLRGAVFIPGWINDLSSPENFFKLPFVIPIVNWTHLNILPFAMTGMMFLQQRFTQSPNTSGTNQMKFLLYAMPIMFFFICYNMPSGLVLYWTMQSLISLFQQILINNLQKKKKEGNVPPSMNEKKINKKKRK